jgi:hypothetical protein
MVTRLIGGLTPGDGADPRTFPAIFNDAADDIEALQDLNPVQFGTAVASGGQVLAFSTAVSGFEPADVFGAAVNGTAVYRFVETVYFTSSGTFTKATYPWLRAIRVKCVGAGGGGGGAASTAGSQAAEGGGGGGGAYAESFITNIAGLDASVTITRGGAGAGGSAGANNGSTGGNSSFGASVIAVGGGGGGGCPAGAVNTQVGNSGTGGLRTSSTGDLTISGQRGEIKIPQNAVTVYGGYGGKSLLSNSQSPSASIGSGGAGDTGVLYGGGGGGGFNSASNATARAGGNGANGIVIVELYA